MITEALHGKDRILLWRLLEDEKKLDGALMMFQSEHSVEKSADSDSTVTKTGTIRKKGVMEEEVSFNSIVAKGDPTIALLDKAIAEGKVVELWEVDVSDEPNAGKYPAIYRQGYITDLSYTANAEDDLEVEGTFATNMMAQAGEATLTLAQIEAAQYKYRDVKKVEE